MLLVDLHKYWCVFRLFAKYILPTSIEVNNVRLWYSTRNKVLVALSLNGERTSLSSMSVAQITSDSLKCHFYVVKFPCHRCSSL